MSPWQKLALARPLPGFISQSWRKNPRPLPDFSPRLQEKIWEWPGDEASCDQYMRLISWIVFTVIVTTHVFSGCLTIYYYLTTTLFNYIHTVFFSGPGRFHPLSFKFPPQTLTIIFWTFFTFSFLTKSNFPPSPPFPPPQNCISRKTLTTQFDTSDLWR